MSRKVFSSQRVPHKLIMAKRLRGRIDSPSNRFSESVSHLNRSIQLALRIRPASSIQHPTTTQLRLNKKSIQLLIVGRESTRLFII